MTIDFPRLAAQFSFQGDFQQAAPFGAGHIHDTYLAETVVEAGAHCRYVLQRVNLAVFPDPEILMGNIERVTDHLRHTIAARGGDPDREALQLVPSRGGEAYLRTAAGEVWRSYHMIEGARTFDQPQNRAQVRSAGRAFGGFLRDMAGFPPEQLQPTIPDFHHTPKRYRALEAAADRDAVGRTRLAKTEIRFAEDRASLIGRLVAGLAEGDLPLRTTHNDTKLNNVMIDDRTGTGVCVVDLDTVMPGTALYDFGDAIRTIAVTAAEDEPDLSKVQLNLDYFEEFTRGYLEAAAPILTPLEIDQLPFSAIVMTLECGIRFLADHLNGDIYFKTQRENHNLDRCRTQFKLVRDMEAQMDAMVRRVDRYR